MPPSPIPAPLPPWARALLQLAPFISAGLQEALQYIHELDTVESETNSGWRKCVFRWWQPTNADSADIVQTTIDIANITNGALDNSWTAQDYSTVDLELAALAANWTARMPTTWTHYERAYYRMAFNPLTQTKPFALSGPPEHVASDNQVGLQTGQQAPQVAVTHTERTAYRKHWGRSYWPIPSSTLVGTDMHIDAVDVDAWAAELRAVYQALQNAEFFPVVPVTQVDKQPTRGLLTVSEIQVDNVFDVIRRRRSHTTTRIAVGGLEDIHIKVA